jgi:signal transduction histidine kinase/ligand-binding sensor domain-containing protein
LFATSFFAQSNELITVNDPALRQKQIRCLFVDNKNRIWCGTDDGIYCYDGYQSIAFKNDKQKKVISDNFILSICSDPGSNLLLFGTNKGITWIDTESMQASFIKADSTADFPLEYIHHLVYAGNREFWGIAHSQPFILIPGNEKIKSSVKKLEINGAKNQLSMQLFSIEKEKSAEREIYLVNGDGNLSKVNKNNLSLDKIAFYRGINSVGIHNNSILFSSFNGFHILNSENGRDSLLPPAEITAMYPDREGNYWVVAARTKLLRFDGGKKLKPVATFSQEEESKYQIIYSVASDKNNIWIGTAKGLLNMKMPKPYFSDLFADLTQYNPGELSSRGMHKVNDTCVLLCGYHYFVSYNPLSGKMTELLPKKDAEKILPYALCHTGDSIWIATEGSGLQLFSLKNKKLVKPVFHNAEKNQFVYRGLLRTATVAGDWIYLGEYGFVGRFNYKNGKVESDGRLMLDNGSNYTGVLQIFPNGNNELIFVSSYLIVVTDTALNIKHTIRSESLPGEVKGLITCATPDSAGMWIGTNAKGLLYLKWNDKKISRLLTDDGLADNTIYSIVKIQNRIFIGTKNGLSVIDKTTGAISNYFEEDGLVNNEFNGSSFLRISDAELLMGGIKGVTQIKPLLMLEKKENPRFFLSKVIMAGNKGSKDSLLLGRLDELKEIELPYQNRFLQIFYSLTNYSSFNRFAYKLEGAGDQWIELGNQNQVMFNSLEPGDYHLRIKAWDERGAALEHEISLRIKAMQVFYKTGGFLIAFVTTLILIVVAAFYIYYRIRIRNIQRLADLRLKIASDLHDQVGGLLNKTAIQAELANSRNNNPEQQLDKIALNSRTALNSMRDILWNLDPRNDNTGSLVERMKEHVMKMLEDDFVYELKIEKIEELDLSHEVRQNLNMVFKEAVNNIVKHAPGSRVKIFFGIEGKHVLLWVHSSAILKNELVSTGQGMRNMRMRAEAIKADFNLDTSDGVGIKISLPLNHIKM